MACRPDVIGVVGAGTMGAGIAQLAAKAGARTLLHDPVPGALERGRAGIAKGLDQQVSKDRMSREAADALLDRIELVEDVNALAPAGLVVEAVPERLDLKLDVFTTLAGLVAQDAVLATNTSSLSVTEIAAGTPGPERVVGLHFFNPAPVMRLVEVVAGLQSSADAVAVARATGEAMGKTVIDAADVAGFLVNRVNRPFSLEALQLVQERIATVEQVDRIARMAGGFRMGPFELMDLIGIDTNHAVAEGFHRRTYGEPRYRPSPLAAQKIAAGQLGRKADRGWYAYPQGRPDDPSPPDAGGGDGRRLAVLGDLPVLDELRERARAAGFVLTGDTTDAWLTVDGTCVPFVSGTETKGTHIAVRFLHGASLHELDPRAAGLHLVPPIAKLAELARTPQTQPEAATRAEELVRALGLHPEWVGDAPGLVLGRIVAQLANEAAFLIGEGNGTPEDVDRGLELGVNHPRGPVAWRQLAGVRHVSGILDALARESGDPRYRLAPLLRRQRRVPPTS